MTVVANIMALGHMTPSPMKKREDENPSLQFMVLLLGWLVAASLAWVGTPLWVWLGGGILLTAGHAFSWMFRDFKSPIRSAFVSVALVGTLALVPGSVGSAISGDWLPVAYFLILFQGVASFEMRTRGGLYASIIISGAIFFFVSQQALDVIFVIFLAGFTTLLLSFLALSFLLDQVRHTDVRWFQSRFSFTFFWTGVFVTSMLVSAAIFLMLPKQFADPVNSAQGAVLPMRASDSIEVPNVSFDGQAVASALPVTSSLVNEFQDGLSEEGTQSGDDTSPNTAEGGQNAPQGTDDPRSSIGQETQTNDANGQSIMQGNGDGSIDSSTIGSGNGDGSELADPFAGDPLIIQVRSPVLTYWREQAFDNFDGDSWQEDTTTWFRRRRGSDRAIYSSPQPRHLQYGPLYNQTFFVKQTMAQERFISGYAPLIASLPKPENGSSRLEDGSVYRVVSSLPDFNIRSLRNADPSSLIEYRYHHLPSNLEELRPLAEQMTEGAFADIDRMRRIVTFIDSTYEYDAEAQDQFVLTEGPLEFIKKQGAGTSMDIATATVLLARAAGIPSRLVTGYLPGQFDPLSGTYMVRESDKHVWAEVFFNDFGWVPFDSAPRPSTAAYGEGGTFFDSAPVNAFFSSNYSEDLYDNIRSSPELLSNILGGNIGEGITTVVGPVLMIASLALTAFAAWRFLPLFKQRNSHMQYARLTGDGRLEMIQTYHNTEKLLQRAGLSERSPSQTITEYTSDVESELGESASDLVWLRKTAWAAAYNSSPFDSGLLQEAKAHTERLKEIIKSKEQNSNG